MLSRQFGGFWRDLWGWLAICMLGETLVSDFVAS